MSVKIELEKDEIQLIKTGLSFYIDECKEVINKGKYLGKKISKEAIEVRKKTRERCNKLIDFFDSL